MSVKLFSAALVAGLAFLATPAQAQRVSADVVVRIGDRYPYGTRPIVVPRRVPARRVIVVERYAPRVIIVERVRHPRGHAYGYWKKHGYRPVQIYYDAAYGRYYDRYDRYHPGLREVTVWERDGRYYRTWHDDDCDHDRDHDYDRDYRSYYDD